MGIEVVRVDQVPPVDDIITINYVMYEIFSREWSVIDAEKDTRMLACDVWLTEYKKSR